MSRTKYLSQYVALILAGEAIFLLPFVLPRVFRTTLLEVYGIDNIDLGYCFSLYGSVAILAYFFGGPLADIFPARKLITAALGLTALGGIYLALNPSLLSLQITYAFWGFSTIFLFWAALMKSTRILAKPENEAKAFGWVEGGRGLSSALWGSLAVFLFSLFFTEGEVASRGEAYSIVMLCAAIILILVAIFVYFILPKKEPGTTFEGSFKGLRQILAKRGIWLQAGIVLVAYCGYKVTDDLSLYAREVWGLSESDSVELSSKALYLRPLAAIFAGFLADRIKAIWVLLLSFGSGTLGAFLLSQDLSLSYSSLSLIYFGIALMGIYALRGIYIALMRENQVERAFSGTAVGIISIIGYLPDVFWSPLMGYILESQPGAAGHQQLFLVLSGFMFTGLLLAWLWERNRLKTL